MWEFAAELPANVAGVIGFGAGLSNPGDGFTRAFGGGRSFAFVGGAGDADFNYVETRAFAAQLRLRKLPARFVEYRGTHEWPPAAICGAALEWMHARAMLAGRIPVDSSFVVGRITAELDSARSLEQRGQRAAAAIGFGTVSDDYAGWPGASEANRRREALTSERAVREFLARSDALAQADQRHATELERELLLARGRSVSVEQLVERLRVAELQRQSATGDSLAAPAARRLLARVHVALAFYEPRAYLAKGAARQALLMLAAASRITPLVGESCTLLARARALAPKIHPELRCVSS